MDRSFIILCRCWIFELLWAEVSHSVSPCDELGLEAREYIWYSLVRTCMLMDSFQTYTHHKLTRFMLKATTFVRWVQDPYFCPISIPWWPQSTTWHDLGHQQQTKSAPTHLRWCQTTQKLLIYSISEVQDPSFWLMDILLNLLGQSYFTPIDKGLLTVQKQNWVKEKKRNNRQTHDVEAYVIIRVQWYSRLNWTTDLLVFWSSFTCYLLYSSTNPDHFLDVIFTNNFLHFTNIFSHTQQKCSLFRFPIQMHFWWEKMYSNCKIAQFRMMSVKQTPVAFGQLIFCILQTGGIFI